MKFTVTEEEAREMAQFEEEAGGDISAGTDWRIHLDKVLELALEHTELVPQRLRVKLVELLSEQLGKVLSNEEIEELVAGFQVQVQRKVAEKLTTQESA
jgi:DNA-binding response OmpR family regulator